MKKTKLFAAIGGLGVVILSVFLIAADHVDAPDVSGTTTDIADLYAFEGDNPNNTVLIATLQGPLMPGAPTNEAMFDESVLIEFNIDNTGDFKEDLVIQAIRRGDSMYFFGPAAPGQIGLNSQVQVTAPMSSVKISGTGETITATNNNMSFFAGPRRDYFFFDFERFNMVTSGEVAPEGFNAEGTDFFENLNVLAISVEVPNSMLGTAPPHVGAAVGLEGLPPAYNVWVSAKRRQ
ncbi:MAG: molecular chaperone DnaK [Flavobacteriaceae bacterium]|nr:molecular chaperone DnaK [Flavobacteriaceae bacterium]